MEPPGESRAPAEIRDQIHESPPVVLMPLYVLAFLSLVGGVIGIPEAYAPNWLVGDAPSHSLNTFLTPTLPEAAPHLIAHQTEYLLAALAVAVSLLGLALARRGARVEICEADRRAVRSGVEAARRAGLSAVFHRASVGSFLDERPAGGRPDGIVVNPPRTGLGRRARKRLLGLGAGRIVMVSCDPATMARDVGQLVEGGYRLVEVRPFDLFPQTWHVETVSLLVRPG